MDIYRELVKNKIYKCFLKIYSFDFEFKNLVLLDKVSKKYMECISKNCYNSLCNSALITK